MRATLIISACALALCAHGIAGPVSDEKLKSSDDKSVAAIATATSAGGKTQPDKRSLSDSHYDHAEYESYKQMDFGQANGVSGIEYVGTLESSDFDRNHKESSGGHDESEGGFEQLSYGHENDSKERQEEQSKEQQEEQSKEHQEEQGKEQHEEQGKEEELDIKHELEKKIKHHKKYKRQNKIKFLKFLDKGVKYTSKAFAFIGAGFKEVAKDIRHSAGEGFKKSSHHDATVIKIVHKPYPVYIMKKVPYTEEKETIKEPAKEIHAEHSYSANAEKEISYPAEKEVQFSLDKETSYIPTAHNPEQNNQNQGYQHHHYHHRHHHQQQQEGSGY